METTLVAPRNKADLTDNIVLVGGLAIRLDVLEDIVDEMDAYNPLSYSMLKEEYPKIMSKLIELDIIVELSNKTFVKGQLFSSFKRAVKNIQLTRILRDETR